MYELPPPPTRPTDGGDWCDRCGWHRAEKPSGLCPVCIDELTGRQDAVTLTLALQRSLDRDQGGPHHA